MDFDNQKVYCETSILMILLLLVVFNVLRFVMKFPITYQRLRQRSLSPSSGSPIIRPPTNPNKSNVDYYRGHTKSIYEREPMFKDFARNIPLSQQNLLDSSNLTSLKNNFQSLVASRAGGQKPDPLRPLAIQTRNHRSASEALAEKHQRSRSSTPVVLPHIYVYHRTGRS